MYGARQQRFAADIATLAAGDPHLAALVDRHGVPTLWTRPAGFPAMFLFILEQQVSLASAAAAYRRVLARIGAMEPAALLASTPEELRADGVSRQKVRYLRALASAIETGVLDLGALPEQPDDQVRRALESLPGIGRWTSDVYLLACLDRPDVWPVGDRALRVATAQTLDLDGVPSPEAPAALGDRWRPHRSTAARLLWHGYLVRRGRAETSAV